MKKVTILMILAMLIVVTKKITAQYYFYDDRYYENPWVYEVGASMGAMNTLTDLGGKKGVGKKFVKDLNMNKTNIAGSFYVSATYKYAVALRLEATFGQIKASDDVLEKVKETTSGRYERNLSFKSKISELSLLTEIHPLYIFNKYYDEDKTPPQFSPYLLGGIGFFSFNPQAKLNDKWIDLQPLSTEGQGFAEYPDRKKYALKQLNAPLGLGVKYELSNTLNIRAELIHRILFTDYLDDVSTTYIDPAVYFNHFTGSRLNHALLLHDRQYELNPEHTTIKGSQRGNPTNNDSYFSFNIKIGYTFGRERRR